MPNTGLEYWRPGVSLVLLLLKPFGGVTLHGALLMTMLAGIVWALAAWFVAMRTTGNRKIALASYTLCLLLPAGWSGIADAGPNAVLCGGDRVVPGVVHGRAPGDRAGFDRAGMRGRGVHDSERRRVAAAGAVVVVLVLRLRAANASQRPASRLPSGGSAAYAVAILIGFGIVLAPMHLLYKHVLGTLFPSGAGQALYLNDLTDFSNYGVPVSLHTDALARVQTPGRDESERDGDDRLQSASAGVGVSGAGLSADARRRAGGVRRTPGRGCRNWLDRWRSVRRCWWSTALCCQRWVFSALRSSTALLPVVSVWWLWRFCGWRGRGNWPGPDGTVLAIYLVSGVMDDRRSIDPMNQIGDADRAQARGLAAMGAVPDGPWIVQRWS